MSIRLRRRPRLLCLVAFACAALSAFASPAGAAGPPGPMKIVSSPGKIVPIPASIPHEAGDMVDRRIVPDLLWIARRYPIYITDGYSGPLPDGRHVGCDECHVHDSDHYNGVAVDLVPVGGGTVCNAAWAPITRLAEWAEPIQNQPRAPFRWVGYNGDAGHGCGNHLHLSWNHAPAPMYQLAEWVEVFPTGPGEAAERAPRRSSKPATAPSPAPSGPSGGISRAQTGGVGVRGVGVHNGSPQGFGD